MLSIAVATTLALAVSSAYAATKKTDDMQEANAFLKNLSSENIDADSDSGSLDDLERELNSLENSITDTPKSNVIVNKV